MFVVIENPMRRGVSIYLEKGFHIEDFETSGGHSIKLYRGKALSSLADWTMCIVFPDDKITYCTIQELVERFLVELI